MVPQCSTPDNSIPMETFLSMRRPKPIEQQFCVARSGLQAFFSRTFLGLRPKDDFDPTHGLRLYSSIGRTIIFNMDVDHQGWLTTDQQTRPSSDEELSVHVRGHFYMYSRDLRYLPTSDLEESFEVMSCVAHGGLDAAKKMYLRLQNIVPKSTSSSSESSVTTTEP